MWLILILDVYVQNHRANGLTVQNKNPKYIKSGFPKKGKNAQIPTTLPNNIARYINVKLFYTQASFKSCFWSFISTENATDDVFTGVNATSFGHFWRGLIVLRAMIRRRFPDQTLSAALSKLENFIVKYEKNIVNIAKTLSHILANHWNPDQSTHRYRVTLVKSITSGEKAQYWVLGKSDQPSRTPTRVTNAFIDEVHGRLSGSLFLDQLEIHPVLDMAFQQAIGRLAGTS